MESLSLFLAASMALIITPGPDLIYVLTRGIADGKLSGVVSAIGVTFGIMVHTLAAALGLAMLLQASSFSFLAIKGIGAAYLMYLGYRMVKNKSAISLETAQNTFDIYKCFTQGFFSNVLNPKIILFFVAFLPQFIQPESNSRSFDMIIYGCTFALMTMVFFAFIGLFAGGIGDWLKDKGKIAENITTGAGVLLLLLGVWLLTS